MYSVPMIDAPHRITWEELCADPSLTDSKAEIDLKRALYFEAGAREVWLCGLQGDMEFFTPAGQTERSPLCPEFPSRIEL